MLGPEQRPGIEDGPIAMGLQMVAGQPPGRWSVTARAATTLGSIFHVKRWWWWWRRWWTLVVVVVVVL